MLRAQLRSGVAQVGLALREPEEFTRRWHGGEVPYSWWVFPALALTAVLGNVPLATWQVVGYGDFDGDGNTDLLWRDTSGDLAIWFLNSSFAVQSTVGLGNVPSTWSAALTGDYDGDGKSDILWRRISSRRAE